MSKTILITGSTDGIGALTAEKLAAAGHRVVLHGRSESKLAAVAARIPGESEQELADLSERSDVEAMARRILERHTRLDILINNAGVLKAPRARSSEGLDLRFMVNTIAPYLLTRRLLPIIPSSGRILNLSSAAQAPVDESVVCGQVPVEPMTAYAQSKLAITVWSRALAAELAEGPTVIAANPGSLLASKMVKEGFGIPGSDLSIGADILCRLALEPGFASASGQYFDNDAGAFAPPHTAATDREHSRQVMGLIERIASQAPLAAD